MLIKKTALKLIIIGGIFMFFGLNFAYLVSTDNMTPAGFWMTHTISTQQVSAERESEDDNTFQEGDNTSSVSSPTATENVPSSITPTESITTPVVPLVSESNTTASSIVITPTESPQTKPSAIAHKNTKKTFSYSSKPVDPSLMKLVDTYEFQNIGDSTRSINGVTGASSAWESGDDKRTLSTVKYYMHGQKLKADFNKYTVSLAAATTPITPAPAATVVTIQKPVSTPVKKVTAVKKPVVKPIPVVSVPKPAPTPTPTPVAVVPKPTPAPIPTPPAPTPAPIPAPTPAPAPAPTPTPSTTTSAS